MEERKSLLPICNGHGLPPEKDDGNVEYKLKLVAPSSTRLEHLITQMKWRLQEGNGEAIYTLGVEDCGTLVGLNDLEMDATLQTVQTMAERLGATLKILQKHHINSSIEMKHVAEVLVRKVPDDQGFIDIRLAVLGNVDTGKSTLLGVLTHGELDNGKGRARLNLFRHLHEIQSGRTSSISSEILGFNTEGEPLNYGTCRTAEEICATASKLIVFIDLAGHQKYLKTTIFGLTSHSPETIMIVVSANSGIAGTTKEHLGYAIALGVPIFFVVSKIDVCSPDVAESTVNNLGRVLKDCGKLPLRVRDINDCILAASQLHNNYLVPVIAVSNVTGKGLDLLRSFLHMLPPKRGTDSALASLPALFQIDDTFDIPEVGDVVSGIMLRGNIEEGALMRFGPDMSGCFIDVLVKSVRYNRQPRQSLQTGQAGTLALAPLTERIPLRKGMVLLDMQTEPSCSLDFEAEIFLLYHTKGAIQSNKFKCTVHTGSVCQTAVIQEVISNGNTIAVNRITTVRFRFVRNPEYIRVGARILFREGSTKGFGQITRVFPFDS